MKSNEHLTGEQLKAYVNGGLKERERRLVGTHLMQCAACRKRLSEPSLQRFGTAIFGERDLSEAGSNKAVEQLKFLNFPKLSPAWSVMVVAIVLGLTIVVWLTTFKASLENREMAQAFELADKEPASAISGNDKKAQTTVIAGSESHSTLPEKPLPSSEVRTQKHSAAPTGRARQNTGLDPNNRLSSKKKEEKLNEEKFNIAPTRGGSTPCEPGRLIETEIGGDKEKIVLKWRKFPDAAKYHLYVSDDEEILIDEYETERETSYVLKKPLDPRKTYNWKLIITLANGNTVAGAARKFTVKDFVQRQKKSEKRTAVRCAAEK